jgi:hypothetical protein
MTTTVGLLCSTLHQHQRLREEQKMNGHPMSCLIAGWKLSGVNKQLILACIKDKPEKERVYYHVLDLGSKTLHELVGLVAHESRPVLFLRTGRKSRCRECGKQLEPQVLKVSISTAYGNNPSRTSVCLSCWDAATTEVLAKVESWSRAEARHPNG